MGKAVPDTVSVDEAVTRIIEATGGDIRLGMPLGLGKPNRLVNALYQRVAADPSLKLTIYTALSLGRPKAGTDLERRFLDPFVSRVFGDYEELDYLRDVRRQSLPDNIEVFEFFFQPGSMLGNATAQQHYINSNYTHVARDLDARRVNVLAQMVAPDPDGGECISLSCNPEVTLDLLPYVHARRAAGDTVLLVGQLHNSLPFMPNDAAVPAASVDLLVDDEGAQTALFATPNMPVTLQDHFIGLNASSLLRDGGTIQIGIGALGDALVHHALMRHHDNAAYKSLLASSGLGTRFAAEVDGMGGREPFKAGLYGCSEMVTAGLLGLVDGGVIRRTVLDDVVLMRLVESGRIGEAISLHTLQELLEEGVLSTALNDTQLDWLHRHGILRERPVLNGETLVFADGTSLVNSLDSRHTREALRAFLGERLRVYHLHGGFYLGPRAFYARLRDMDANERARINMTHISFVNSLLGDEALKRQQRRDARFINTAFSATLMGAAISDQLEDGKVLSGVGGQYNFVAQAHELAGARSVLMLRAWRERGGEASSNLVWNYGHTTIPRHLRDVFVTEYGVADVRGKADGEVIAAMLNIADSRFQAALQAQAVAAGKLSADHTIPEAYRHNTPERLAALRDQAGAEAFPLFPLGCDFDATEQRLIRALGWLKEKMSHKDYLALGRGALHAEPDNAQQYAAPLERMGLSETHGLRERLYRRLLLAALEATE